jgi:ketosteroid isomerase-like protein
MATNTTVQNYYDALAQRDGWQSHIADDMAFTGPGSSANGKAAYVEVTSRFMRVVKTVAVKDLIIEGDKACAIARYDLESPKGYRWTCDVAEILSVKDGKIASSTIFFDTAGFREFMAK